MTAIRSIPADGIIASGATSVDESLLTGEAKPRARTVGDTVAAGSVNLDGLIEINVIREPNDGYWSDVWMKKGMVFSY